MRPVREILLVGAMTVGLGVVPAFAGQINFDSISTSSWTAVPTHYDGFTWDSNWAVGNIAWYNSSYANSTSFPSNPNAAFNNGVTQIGGAVEQDLFAPAPTVFTGAMFSTWDAYNAPYAGSASSSITVQGWSGSTLEWTASEDLTSSFTNLAFGSQPVTELTFLNDGTAGHYWLVDNIGYSTVPEPASLWLFGAGLLVLGAGVALRRRRTG